MRIVPTCIRAGAKCAARGLDIPLRDADARDAKPRAPVGGIEIDATAVETKGGRAGGSATGEDAGVIVQKVELDWKGGGRVDGDGGSEGRSLFGG